jgi:Flp pilus assembly protein TadG
MLCWRTSLEKRDSARRRPRRRAAHILEFAVVSIVFFVIVLGIIEACRMLMVCRMLSDASFRACRTVVIEGTANSDAQSAIDAYLPSIGISGYSMTVLVNDTVADASTANANDEVTVQVSVPVSSVTWIPGQTFFFSGSLMQQSTLRRE